jgi:hypothetical protein
MRFRVRTHRFRPWNSSPTDFGRPWPACAVADARRSTPCSTPWEFFRTFDANLQPKVRFLHKKTNPAFLAHDCKAGGVSDADLLRDFPDEDCSVIATAMARVAFAEHVQAFAQKTNNYTLGFRAHAFAYTHYDLLVGVRWVENDGWTDRVVIGDGSWTGLANRAYPYDGRVITEGSFSRDPLRSFTSAKKRGHRSDFVRTFGMRVLRTDLGSRDQRHTGTRREKAQGSFFLNESHTIVNERRKPRACLKRAWDVIMQKTASACPAFSVWMMSALRCMILGSIAHAKCRIPLLVAARHCEPFFRRAHEDIEGCGGIFVFA